jgi:hypothetical protein
MNLIPFLGFGRKPGDQDENEELDLPSELVELPADEEPEDEEEEEKPNEETRGEEEEDDDRPISNDDEMLRVFIAVDEEFVDNSGLAGRIEDVQAAELVEELRVLASAFGINVETTHEEAV